jgi:pyruvate,water dikinase
MSVFANTMFDGAKYERKLGDRSYAILSQNYCNFSSRLGYHFSIVDAFLGDDEHENYISFRFKGGAARIENAPGGPSSSVRCCAAAIFGWTRNMT